MHGGSYGTGGALEYSPSPSNPMSSFPPNNHNIIMSTMQSSLIKPHYQTLDFCTKPCIPCEEVASTTCHMYQRPFLSKRQPCPHSQHHAHHLNEQSPCPQVTSYDEPTKNGLHLKTKESKKGWEGYNKKTKPPLVFLILQHMVLE